MASNVTWDLVARDKFSRTYDKAATKSETLGSKLKRLAPIAAAAGAALAVKFGADSVRAFTEAETAQTKLSDAFARFPKLADTNIGSLRNLNKELALKTRFDDDAFASGQAVLAQFGLTGKQLQDLTPLVADYAAKTGKDLPAASKTLGKAFLGNTRALKELGINYKMTGDQATDIANITKLVRQQVGGFAEKEGKTAAGQTAILRNQFGELQEQVGEKLIPILKSLLTVGLQIIDWMRRNTAVVKVALGVLAALAVTIGVVKVATIAWTAATKIATVATKAWTVAQKLLNLALRANPIGIVITVLFALGAALVAAYKKSETFRRVVKGALEGIKVVAGAVWFWIRERVIEPFQRGIRAISDRLTRTRKILRAEWLQIESRAAAAWAWLNNNVFRPIRRGLQRVADAWKKVATSFGTGIKGNVSIAYSYASGMGGRQSRTTASMAGRAFPLPPGTYRWGQGPAGHGYDAQDLPVPSGTPVFAPVSGNMQAINLGNRSYGMYVQIISNFGRVILAHLSRFARGSGFVRAGQQVGWSGSTGNSTGPHLHVEPSGILRFAKGGVIPEHVIGVGLRTGRGYEFGEGGPETVIPGVRGGGGGGFTVNVYTGVGDPKAIGREVVKAVGSYLVAGGRLPPKWHTA